MKVQLFNKDFAIYTILALILLMLTARLAFHVNLPPIFILATATIPALFATESQIVAMAVSFLALGTGFQYKFALLIYILVGLIRFKHKIRLNQMVVPVVLMMFWELMHVFSGGVHVFEFFREFAELMFLIFIALIRWDDVNYKLISRTLAFSVVGVCAVIIIVHLQNGFESVLDLFNQNSVDGARFGQGTTKEGTQYGLNFNANRLGFICNMSISSLLLLLYRKEGTIIDVLLLGLCFFCGLTTLSRTYVVVLLLQLIAFIFISPGGLKRKMLTFIKLLTLALILLYVVWEIFPFVFENFIKRNETDDITNGRAFLMNFYNTHIFSSFSHCFFGLGLQDYGGKIADIYGPNILVCHNGFQELWVTWGIPGIILFTYLIVCMIKLTRKYSGVRPLLSFIPLIAFFVDSMAGQLISSGPAMLSLSLFFVTLCLRWDIGSR